MPDKPEEIKDTKLFAAFEKFIEWSSLPRHFSKLPEAKLNEMGLSSELVEMLKITTKKDFASTYCVTTEMLRDWEKHPDFTNRIKMNWKKWTKHLTPGIMGKFAEKLMQEADPARMNIWLKVVEDEGKDEGRVNLNIGIDNIIKSMKEDGDFNKPETPNA